MIIKLKDLIVKESLQKEGLIKTIDSKKAVQILQKMFGKYEVEFDIEDGNYSTDSFSFIDVIFYNPKPEEYPNLIINTIKVFQNLGYYPASIKRPNAFRGDKMSQERLDYFLERGGAIEIHFEPTYSDEKPQFKYLYHATPAFRYEKIKRIGLVPKSRSKKTKHADRIYFATNPRDARLIAAMLANYEKRFQYEEKKPYIILRINTESIPNFKIYQDPAWELGVYSTSNIPPSAIEIEDEITV